MVRSLIVLILSMMAALPSPMVMAGTEEPSLEQILPANDLVAQERAAVFMQLAQASTNQRGPRELGAVADAVQVPSLKCLPPAGAERLLRGRRLSLGQVHRRSSNVCPNGTIVAQSPPPGRRVRAGTAVEVVVNAGAGPAPTAESTVPELQGLTPAEAQSLLRSSGLDIGQIKRENAPAPLGTIVAQSPTAGSAASRGTRINITVASEVKIPDLRTLNQADAVRTLQESLLALGRVTEESSSQPNGTIIKQWPQPGVPAAIDDKVDITLAKGQIVPDLGALTLNDARAKLRGVGLRPGRVESKVSNKRRGTIIEQQPAADTIVKPGIAVNVILAATPIAPDVAGRTLDDAKRLITAQLLKVGSVTSRISSEKQGTVIEQRPPANAEVTPGGSVDLVLAKTLEVPKLVGLSLEEAGAVLAKQLMRLGEVQRKTTPDGDGLIIGQSPIPGASGSFGVGINVMISEPPIIPDLRGLSANAAKTKLAEMQLVLADVEYQLSAEASDQTVLSQVPSPGAAITDGKGVSVVLAVTLPPPDRPDLVPVPNVTRLTAAQADQVIKAAGLILQLDGSGDRNGPSRVTAQLPTFGRLIKVGSPVVAQIESIDEVLVPDLLGVVQDSVDTRLADVFLAVGRRDWRLSTKPDGTVINQDPPPGTPVALGNTVDVVLSASTLIPDLTGLTPEEANPILTSQSLKLGGIQEIFSLRWPGTIVEQIPDANSPAQLNSIVQVEVVGLAGPLTAGGSLLLALAGLVWFRARQGIGHAPETTPKPPPVYGISRSAAPRPVFDKTTRAATRPKDPVRPEPDYVVHVDAGTQVIQTDAAKLVKSSIQLRGRVDPGEQTLAIETP